MFSKATKYKAKLRLALCGVSGSGKTYSALRIAQGLGEKIAVIDTEHGSASRYADLFDFDTCELKDHHPNKYVQAIKAASEAGYDVIIIDSLSHAWFWELNEVDRQKNSFQAWGSVRPLERALVDAMLSSSCHVIATMRSKSQYVMEEYQNKSGRVSSSPKRVGTAPIQALGIEYEFDICGEMNLNHILTLSKSRCSGLADTQHHEPGRELGEAMLKWVSEGEDFPTTPPRQISTPTPTSKPQQHPNITRIIDRMVALDLTSADVKKLTTDNFDGKLVQNMKASELAKLELMMEKLSRKEEPGTQPKEEATEVANA